MDIEALKKALDNESNESICNLNSSLIISSLRYI